MDVDLFSKLFELFNQPGPVNWKLATEAAHHLAGEPSPVDPWAAEELRELVRLAEVKLAEVAPFPVATASDVLVLDPRGWVDRSLRGFTYLAEGLAAGMGSEAPAGMGASLAGMQVGALVGGLSRQIVASVEVHWSANTKNTSSAATVAGVNTGRPVSGSRSARIASRSEPASSPPVA